MRVKYVFCQTKTAVYDILELNMFLVF